MSRRLPLLLSSLLFILTARNHVSAFSLPPTSFLHQQNGRNQPSKTRLNVSTSIRPNRQEYQILGVSPEASLKEIKTAYRKLAKRYHPDANPDEDTTEQFQVINTAYETLKELIENPPPEPKGWKANVNNGSQFNSNTSPFGQGSPFGTVDYASPYGNSRSSPFNGGGFGDSSRSNASPYGYGCYSHPQSTTRTKKTTTQTNGADPNRNGQSQRQQHHKNGSSFYGGKSAESFYTGKVGDSSYNHGSTYSADTTIKSPFVNANKSSATPPPPPDTTIKNPFGSAGPAAGTKRTIQSPFDKGPTTTTTKKTVSTAKSSTVGSKRASVQSPKEETKSFYGGKTAESFYTGKVSDASYDHSTTYSGDTTIKSPFSTPPKKNNSVKPPTSNTSHTNGPKRQVPKATQTATPANRSNTASSSSSYESAKKTSASNTASTKSSNGYAYSTSSKPKVPDFTTGSSFNKKVNVPKAPAPSRPASSVKPSAATSPPRPSARTVNSSTVKPSAATSPPRPSARTVNSIKNVNVPNSGPSKPASTVKPPAATSPKTHVSMPKSTSGSFSSTYNTSNKSSHTGSTVGRQQSSSRTGSTTPSNTSPAPSSYYNVNTTPPSGGRNGPSTVPPTTTFTKPTSDSVGVKRSTPSKRPDLGNTSYVKGSVMMGRSSNRSSPQSTQSYSGTGVDSKEVARTRGANIRNDSFYSGTGAGSIEVARPLRDPRHAGPVEVGKDIRHDLEIDVDMAVFGGEQKIRFRRLEACNNCLASGIRPGSKKQSCNACGGVICMTPAAFQDPVCASCDGTGLQKPRSCRKCKGTGVRKRRKELKVNVPQNVEDGNWIRIPGEGDAGPFGGPPGDLYVFLTVKDVPSETKRRRILNKTWRPLSRFAGRQVQRAKRINARPISNFAVKQWQRVKQVDVRPVSRFAGKQWQRMKGVVRRIKDDDDGPSLRP